MRPIQSIHNTHHQREEVFLCPCHVKSRDFSLENFDIQIVFSIFELCEKHCQISKEYTCWFFNADFLTECRGKVLFFKLVYELK